MLYSFDMTDMNDLFDKEIPTWLLKEIVAEHVVAQQWAWRCLGWRDLGYTDLVEPSSSINAGYKTRVSTAWNKLDPSAKWDDRVMYSHEEALHIIDRTLCTKLYAAYLDANKGVRPFAVCAVAWVCHGWGRKMIAACSREDGSIGLPGGKVEDGEDPFDAVVREALEEGWVLQVDDPKETAVIKKAMVSGKMIWWIKCKLAPDSEQMIEWKEKYRGIYPMVIPPDLLCFESNKFLSENYEIS